MCIANLDGFDIDWALKAQRKTQAKTNSTFDKIKKVNLL
jgi:hypothetical protein